MLFDLFRNYLNALVGRNQEFEKLLAAKDISAVKERMDNRMDMAIAALKEYEVTSHEIMKREDKIITDKKGNFIRLEPVWKLPIPYQVYINEIALVFLYGRPVKWTQQSTGTDRAFQKFQDVIERTHFNSKLRQCKRIAGSETESAMLFRVFRDANDIYTPNIIYRCTRKSIGWEVVEEVNFIGKIPLILFQQDKEWNGVETLIHREELIGSRTADTNDYFADPIAIMAADLIKNLPEKKEAAKLLVTNDSEGVDKAAKYLTWDSAPESKKQEIEWLQNHILSKSFTPNISLDTLKSLSNLSGKALRTVMLLADIKAAKHKETHDELLSRTSSLITAIIGNVLDVHLKTECENLKIGHEFQEPFGDDIAEALENIIKSLDGGIMATETGVELNPLVKDKKLEMERLKAEEEERAQKQQQIFGDIEGAGPQSASDGDDPDDDENGDEDDPKKKQQQKK